VARDCARHDCGPRTAVRAVIRSELTCEGSCRCGCCTLLLYSRQITGSGFRIHAVNCGATGIRTPDLLHAIQRQNIHRRPPVQVTVPGRPHGSPGIQAGCCTFLLYRSADEDGPGRRNQPARDQSGLVITLPAEPPGTQARGRNPRPPNPRLPRGLQRRPHWPAPARPACGAPGTRGSAALAGTIRFRFVLRAAYAASTMRYAGHMQVSSLLHRARGVGGQGALRDRVAR
jgi:hypothetical protein